MGDATGGIETERHGNRRITREMQRITRAHPQRPLMAPIKIDLRSQPSFAMQSTRGDAIGFRFRMRLNGLPEDVSAYTFAAQLRTAVDAPSPTSFVTDMTEAADGYVTISIDDTTSFDLDTTYVWDCEDTTNKRTVARGTWDFDGDVRTP